MKQLRLILSLVVATFMLQACAQKKQKMNDQMALATFGNGCFWCTEAVFEQLEGVRSVVSGYSGGRIKNPTYKQVSRGRTGHVEALQVYYDPAKVSYETLVSAYWRMVNPTDAGGQFADRGETRS